MNISPGLIIGKSDNPEDITVQEGGLLVSGQVCTCSGQGRVDEETAWERRRHFLGEIPNCCLKALLKWLWLE